MTVGAQVKGWCPGAYRPMASGDGLIVRVRPHLARLDLAQICGLCDLASLYGSGVIDLTNRANLQIRGVTEKAHGPLIDGLAELGLLDATPAQEARRNILVDPFWQPAEATQHIAQALRDKLADLPELPAKFGFAVDVGAGLLQDASADIRVERGAAGLIIRADGAARGRPTTPDTAVQDSVTLAKWFAAQRTSEDRRMRHLLAHAALPDGWASVPPCAPDAKPVPGPHALGQIAGAAFGQLDAQALSRLMETSGATALRVTPWRLFVLEGARALPEGLFVTRSDDPLLRADACPGAPVCPSATVDTRSLARRLASSAPGSLHVSGCTKGCARSQPADLTIVGENGYYSLVCKGRAWDAPRKTGLRPEELVAEVNTLP